MRKKYRDDITREDIELIKKFYETAPKPETLAKLLGMGTYTLHRFAKQLKLKRRER